MYLSREGKVPHVAGHGTIACGSTFIITWCYELKWVAHVVWKLRVLKATDDVTKNNIPLTLYLFCPALSCLRYFFSKM